MLYSRYAYAAELAQGRRVLEIGCGPGMGLDLIHRSAEFVVAADFDQRLLSRARMVYGTELEFVGVDVQALPFRDQSFDLVIFFEGSYYVPDMHKGFQEMARVLSDDGMMVFVNANPERPDFIPSPLSCHYHTAEEFRHDLTALGFDVTVEGAFPVQRNGITARLLSGARKWASRAGLVPGTLRGRALLKRLMYGPLIDVPLRINEGFSVSEPRVHLHGAGPFVDWKVIYVTARRI